MRAQKTRKRRQSIRKTPSAYRVDFHVDGKRVRKVLPTRDAAKQYMADETTPDTKEKYFGVQREEYDTFNDLFNWYKGYPTVARKKGFTKECDWFKLLGKAFGHMKIEAMSPEDIGKWVNSELRRITHSELGGHRGEHLHRREGHGTQRPQDADAVLCDYG